MSQDQNSVSELRARLDGVPSHVAINGKSVDLKLNVGRAIYGKQNGSDYGNLESGPVSTMFIDPSVLAKSVWDNYRDRLEAAGVETDSAFYELCDGAMLRKIEEPMKKAIVDFFPWGAPTIAKIEDRIGRLGEIMDQMSEPSGLASGVPQESLASTPQGSTAT